MHCKELPYSGVLALVAFVASILVGVFWFNSTTTAQAGTGETVEVQAVIANKTTVHQPISATTNGTTVRRMENSFVVTLAFQDGRKPPQEIDQQVNIAFFDSIEINSPVRVTLDPVNARIVELTPGTLADPQKFLVTCILGALFVALGLGAAIWRRRTFEMPPA